MQTIKLKYYLEDKSKYSMIKEYMQQYSSCLHFMFNRVTEGKSEKDCRNYFNSLNNIDKLDFIMKQCAIKEAQQIYKSNKTNKLIFGGRNNFNLRCKNKISSNEFRNKRLNPLYIIGRENLPMGNQKFKLQNDLKTIVFQPKVKNKIILNLTNLKVNYYNILKQLYSLGLNKQICLTYKLDLDYVYISFDESILSSNYPSTSTKIENRIFSIDLNPNYIGWSVIDWRSSSDFSVVKSGIISSKLLNDKELALKGQGISPEDPRRIYLHNKREHEVYEISKSLIDKALYYKCSIFSIEDLSMKSSDKGNGKKFNSLCNNLWLRDKLVNNLTKRCNIFNIKLLKVKPEYSSFIGNFLFRDLNLPDMVLSSIEISRRAYEFYNQYIIKTKEIKKNIVQPDLNEFRDRYFKSLEEFKISGEFTSLIDLYYFFKKSKMLYRLSLDKFKDLKFSSLKHNKSLICNLSKFNLL